MPSQISIIFLLDKMRLLAETGLCILTLTMLGRVKDLYCVLFTAQLLEWLSHFSKHSVINMRRRKPMRTFFTAVHF